MKPYFNDRMEAVRFVYDTVLNSKPDSPLTMTITREKFGGYSVSTAIEESSEDIGLQTARFFSETQVNT